MSKTNDFISRNSALHSIFNGEHNLYIWDEIDEAISAVPAADVVTRDAFNRLLAENDDMRAQLSEIGKHPGDSMEDVRRVVFCRECIHSGCKLKGMIECIKDTDHDEATGVNYGFSEFHELDFYCAAGERKPKE